MRHLVICEYGTALGVTGARVTVKQKGELIAEYPLSRLHTITIAKEGVSLSSNLIQEGSSRGIRIFILNGIGECVAAVSGIRSHGVGQTRRHQILFLEDGVCSAELAMRIMYGKLRNQRAVICYFAKSAARQQNGISVKLTETAEQLKAAADQIAAYAQCKEDCRASLLGIEGSGASLYWHLWPEVGLLPESFCGREGRGSPEPVNAALNYGYAILSSRIWNAILVAGLEPYLGFFHVERPGKPSLVLDLIEEYRAWCVDRIIIKNRTLLARAKTLTPLIKKRIIDEVQNCFATEYAYKGKRLSLDSILQRQVYRLVGHFAGNKNYKPYLFKW
ncbi:MAG: CRISPR-associated endonuclease Cas1 [Kiritimatiellae bacterium]|nr:CRISPR-associated endonuclease Cas1 [Kiritimatiellia bacterium]